MTTAPETSMAPKRVVACIDSTSAADAVVATAAGVAKAMEAELDIISIVEPDVGPDVGPVASVTPGERSLDPMIELQSRFPQVRLVAGPAEQTIVDELSQADVLFGVLGSSSADTTVDRLGHVARDVMTRCRRPLIVVPFGSVPLSGRGERFLVPFDGHSNTSNAVAAVLADLVQPMGSIIPMHVFDEVPMFVSSEADRGVLAEEFAARHIGSDAGEVERPRLYVGDPLEEILRAGRREHADAVVVAWSQTLEPGRAPVIRGLLAEAGIPILFHPIETIEDDQHQTEPSTLSG